MRQLISRQRFRDAGRVRHIDRLGNSTRDERLCRCHHVDMAFHRQIPLALFAASIGAIEDVVVVLLQEGRAFQRHRAANMVVAGVDLGLGKAQMAQQVKAGVSHLVSRNAQGAFAEIFTQRPLVKDKADVKGRGQGRFDLFNLARAKAVTDQRGVVDRRGLRDRPVAHGIGHHLGDLVAGIAQGFQSARNRLVDDLKVTAARQFLELNQGKVRLDARGVAIHHQSDCARGGDNGGLRVAVAMRLAQGQRFIPSRFGQGHQRLIGAIAMVQRDRINIQPLISARAMGCRAVVADHAQHVFGVAIIAGESAQFLGHLGRGGIGYARHKGCQRPAQSATFFAVIA